MPFISTNRLVLLLVWVASMGHALAQEPQVLSPYSAYGLGDVAPGMFAEQRAMGGVSLGVVDGARINPDFAASYGSLSHATFSTSFRTQSVREQIGEQEFKRNFAQFLGLGVAMPVKRGAWALGFGLIPKTDVGYELKSNIDLSNGAPVEYNYSGSGGLNTMYLGTSARVLNKRDTSGNVLSRIDLGAQFNYNFGTIGTSRRVIFPPSEGFYNTNSTANVILRGGTFDLSLMYRRNISVADSVKVDDKKKYVNRKIGFSAGLLVGLGRDISARRTDLTTTYLVNTVGVEFVQDTVEFIDRAQGKVTIPPSFGIGLGVQYEDRLKLNVEFRQQLWSSFAVDVEGWDLPEKLSDRSSFAVGLAYNAGGFSKLNDNKKFFEQIEYYLGYRGYNDYLSVNNSQLSGYGLSGGLSVPLFGFASASKFTFGMELGSRGDVGTGGIEESYTEFFAGFSITPSFKFDPQWFRKRRIE